MKTLFVDFYNTICFDKFWRSAPDKVRHAIHDYLFATKGGLVDEWMTGKYTAEEVNKKLADDLGLDYETLWNTFVSDCKTMSIDAEILFALSTLKQKYYLVLITGNMDSFEKWTVPALKLDSYFDVISNTYSEKMLKTADSGKLFLKYLKGDITDAVFIDDTPHACKVFTKLGGTAHQTTSKEDTIKILQNLLH